jgi:alkaline phosphatase D
VRRIPAIVALALTPVLALTSVPPATAARFAFPEGVASGDVTSSSAVLWTRTSRAGTVVAEVATDRRFLDVVRIARGKAREERDLTVELRVGGLDAGEDYHYRFLGPGGARSRTGVFGTAPARGETATIRFVYSGDSDGTPAAGQNYRDEIAASAAGMANQRADFFVYLGDTIYSDSGLASERADSLDEYRAKYREVRSIGALLRLLRSTSVVAQWDDHEVRNDFASVPPFAPAGVTAQEIAAGRQAFGEYFPLREGGGGRTYRRLRWGPDLEVFVLDERSYRTSPQAVFQACFQPSENEPDVAPTLPQPLRSSFAAPTGRPYLASPPPAACLPAIADASRTMLGVEQKAWLKNGLQNSRATFKVVVNEVPIQEIYANPYDRWEGYAAERQEILSFIRDNGITGVFFATTDTHATIANQACITTLGPGGTYDCNTATAPWEVVAGPIGTETFASQVDAVAPGASPLVAGFIRSFLHSPCVDLDESAAWATAVLNGRRDTLTIIPKRPGGRRGQPICEAPIVVQG